MVSNTEVVGSMSPSVTDEIAKARRMYMAGLTTPNILRLVRLDKEQLHTLIMGKDGSGKEPDCWYSLRIGGTDEIVLAASVERLNFSLECTGLASAVLHESLTQLNIGVKCGGRTLSVKEMESLASIVEKLDKIVRLEKGSPTEIVSKAGLSVEEAREILRNDPFAPKVIEAEVVKTEEVGDDLLG